MAQVNWTREAEEWLRRIYEYIAQDNPAAAARVVDAIYLKAEMLEEHPLIGQRLLDWPRRHIRTILYGHYRITYLVKDDETLDILGVFHDAMDLEAYLPKELS